MPELPEIETTRRGIGPRLAGRTIRRVEVRQPALRWPVPEELPGLLEGQCIKKTGRRGKYLLLDVGSGTVLLHLGMSGSLRILGGNHPAGPHDHLDFHLDNGRLLRFTDPRRFGSVLWIEGDPTRHRLLAELGPEPLEGEFSGEHLYAGSRGRRVNVKSYIMNSRTVTGVGNIYANESLFTAGIDPRREAGSLSRARYIRLAKAVRHILRRSIRKGGTTLKDFVDHRGRPGYFQQMLEVYDRGGMPCRRCGRKLHRMVLGGRQTVLCTRCQS